METKVLEAWKHCRLQADKIVSLQLNTWFQEHYSVYKKAVKDLLVGEDPTSVIREYDANMSKLCHTYPLKSIINTSQKGVRSLQKISKSRALKRKFEDTARLGFSFNLSIEEVEIEHDLFVLKEKGRSLVLCVDPPSNRKTWDSVSCWLDVCCARKLTKEGGETFDLLLVSGDSVSIRNQSFPMFDEAEKFSKSLVRSFARDRNSVYPCRKTEVNCHMCPVRSSCWESSNLLYSKGD